jgi:hypothetical protein
LVFGCAGVSSKPRPLGEGGYRVGCGEFEPRRNSWAGAFEAQGKQASEGVVTTEKAIKNGRGSAASALVFGCAGVSSKPRPLGEGGYREACGEFESRRNSRAGQAPPLQGEWNGGWRAEEKCITSLFKITFGCGEFVAVASDPNVEGRQQENTQKQSSQEAADDNNGEGTLRVGTNAA